ncbi:very-long-chain 3-oxoacyl-CoA reductase-B-like [Dasypus novemcinctus]|uniref:very-long-chain 3-oxoacyl-CoA reductase-B-like n=1 Tax=Dasypus novemcinctus TaxID=9361 RepID=UPI00265D95B9|nr:very-long-chain 3-oxoacyl-CoA reductase-B-like [Dasypus novemcinctus]
MESGWDVLRALGTVAAAWLLLRAAWGVGRAVYVYLLPPVRRGDPWLRSQGAWAVVTGATAGIGKAYAHELARRGLNIVLISRNLSKLEQEAEEIEQRHGRTTRVLQADFTGGLEIYEAIEAELQELDIGVLVNNVAMMYFGNRRMKLLDAEDPAKALADIVNCNVLSVAQVSWAGRGWAGGGVVPPEWWFRAPSTVLARVFPGERSSRGRRGGRDAEEKGAGVEGAGERMERRAAASPASLQMTRIVLPQMVARGRGVIINISSEAENRPFPFLAAYAATKAFVGSFSRAVGAEYLSQGVTVQTVSPCLVATNMTKHLNLGLLLKDPRDLAREPGPLLAHLWVPEPGCAAFPAEFLAAQSMDNKGYISGFVTVWTNEKKRGLRSVWRHWN